MTVGITVALPGGGENGVHYPSAYTGQSVADAVYETVHNYSGGVTAVAAKLGVSKNTLTHKVNPNAQTNHVLGLEEALRIAEATNNVALVHSICARFGGTFTRAAPLRDEAAPMELMRVFLAENAEFAHAFADALPAADQPFVSKNALRRCEYRAQQLQSAIGHILGSLRAWMRKG